MKLDRRYLNASRSQLVAAGAGLLVGGLGGYLLGRVLAKHKAEEAATWRIASEVESVKQHYRKREHAAILARANAAGKGDNPNERAAAALGDAGNVAESGATDGAGSMGDDDTGTPAENLLHEIFVAPADVHPGPGDPMEGFPGTGTQEDDHSDEDDHEDGEDGTEADDGELTPPDQSGPYIITHEQFSDEYLAARKLSVTYYADDDILCDDRDVPFNDRVRTVGADFADHFGDRSADPDMVYVRNRRIDIDFEIIRNHGSYKQVVLGYGKPQ